MMFTSNMILVNTLRSIKPDIISNVLSHAKVFLYDCELR